MRWIVGIDFNGRSAGALRMAAWLRQRASKAAPQELVGVHVLPDQVRRAMVREATVDLPPTAIANIRRLVADSGVVDPLTDIRAEWAGSAEEGLTLAAATPDVDGIVIGRAATVHSRSLARLGRVARRLLRHLPAPVMVVPPDLKSGEIGGGPIVLATDLGESSNAAGRMARELALDLGRALLVVHVDDTLHNAAMMAPEAITPLTYAPRCTIEDVRMWTTANGLPAASAHLADGERISTLVGIARDRDAAMIVCGSRCASIVDRIFMSSTATALARVADRPVLVVPSRDAA